MAGIDGRLGSTTDDPLKSLVKRPSLLGNCYLENKFQYTNQGESSFISCLISVSIIQMGNFRYSTCLTWDLVSTT